MPEVSVIIPTYNRSQKVVRAIESVLGQSFRDFEVIVVDDGSTDDTYQSLTRFGSSITYIRSAVNRGVSAARNAGVKGSSAPWIAFLDSDDYWLREKLQIQVESVRRNPEWVACQTEEIWIRRGRRVNPKTRHKKPSGDIFKQSLRLCLVSPSSVIVSRGLFDEVGLFDERLQAAEDYDLWLRISCRYPVYLIPQELVVKEGGHEDQLSTRFPGMDRFRINSIVNLINSGVLSSWQTAAALEELSVKCRVFGNGCIKRGRHEEGHFYLTLPDRMKAGEQVSLGVTF
jgi:glycosyltransferase involved in cell wall biosynthesis